MHPELKQLKRTLTKKLTEDYIARLPDDPQDLRKSILKTYPDMIGDLIIDAYISGMIVMQGAVNLNVQKFVQMLELPAEEAPPEQAN